MNRVHLLLIILLQSLFSPVYGQSQISSEISSEYDKWSKAFLSEYSEYKDAVDQQFATFLNQQWKAFDTQEGEKRDEVPKPIVIPRIPLAITKPTAANLKPEAEKTPIIQTVIIPEAPPAILIIPPLEITPKQGTQISVPFFGHQVKVHIDIKDSFKLNSTIDKNTILDVFNILATSNYSPLISELNQIRVSLKLNDWAFIQLIQKISSSFTKKQANESNLLSWFLLIKSGLDARVSYAKNEVYLLAPAKQPLYDATYFKYNDENYYIVSQHSDINKRLYSYNANYPQQLKAADYYYNDAFLVNNEFNHRNFEFWFKGKKHQIALPYNQNNIDFLASYPQMDLEYYFEAANNNKTAYGLIEQLSPLMQGMGQKESVDFLLRFVQTAFEYATDKEQFGKENYLFLEETIFYPQSDCEDRAILFAWLVDNLLNLKVVGLNFPGHVAAAVLLDTPIGDTLTYRGEVYTITDPTYINARSGMKMPQYKTVTPTVVPHIE